MTVPKLEFSPSKRPCARLIGVLEPVIADDIARMQSGGHVMLKTCRPLGLGRDQRSRTVAIGQTGIGAAKGELADQARLAGSRIGFDDRRRITIVAVERYDVVVTPGVVDHLRAMERRRTDSPARGDWDRPL